MEFKEKDAHNLVGIKFNDKFNDQHISLEVSYKVKLWARFNLVDNFKFQDVFQRNFVSNDRRCFFCR